MLYRVAYTDGSTELVEADNIKRAREEARSLYDAARVRRVQAVEDDLVDDDEDEDEEEDDDDVAEDAEEGVNAGKEEGGEDDEGGAD